MKPKSKTLRSRSFGKTTYVQMKRYKPRDWGYQSPKHQILPQFVMGHSKKRIPVPKQEEFPVFKDLTNIQTAPNSYKRILKPAVFRSYILSQIATLPGAVKVEESKINDDKGRKDKIKVIKNNNLCFKNKLNFFYDSKVPFLPGSKEEEKITVSLKKVKSLDHLKVLANNTAEKLKVNKIKSPDRNRIKRNKKN